MKKYFLFSIFGIFLFSNSHSQITVSQTGGPASIASFLTGYGVTISNVVVNADTGAIGYFTSNNTNLNMPAGLALTTGNIHFIPGPNNISAAGSDNGFPGDSDLTTLAGTSTYNACVLEFDCVPANDTLFFNYLFGSEEYPEYVGSFNDVFAIYISGPNIPFQNMAFVPNTTTPVCIDSINNGNQNLGPCLNCSYYVDNTGDSLLQYDGTTTNLTAQIPVMPNATYHFKIAIADAVDGVLDSGVLLEAGSFRCMNPNGISVIDNDNGIKMFPVPSNNTVNFSFKKLTDPNVEINIHSLSGQEVFSQKISVGANGTAALDVSNFAQGMYTVEIIADGQKEVRLLPVTRN